MFIRLTALLLLVFSLCPAAAMAVDYTVSNLAVDVEGENAIDAREKALAQARSNAFNILKKRLAGDGMTGSIPTPDDSTIASMVNSFEINREKLSKNRYLASVNVAFNPRAVQGYTQRQQPSQQSPDYIAGNVGNAQDNRQFQSPYGNTSLQQQQQQLSREGYGGQPSASGRNYASGAVKQSRIRVDIADIRQWINIKKMLESMYSIQSVEISQISSRRAIVNLSHTGTINDLQNDMIGRGMRLYANTDASKSQIPYILITRG